MGFMGPDKSKKTSVRPTLVKRMPRPASAAPRVTPVHRGVTVPLEPPVPTRTSRVQPLPFSDHNLQRAEHRGHSHSHSHGGGHIHDEKCICEICSCGRHHCPPTPRMSHYGPDVTSAYKNDYQGIFAPPERVVHRDMPIGSSMPFDANSTTRADFQWRGMPERARPAQSVHDRSFLDRSMPFEGESTNKADFKEWKVGPARAAPRDMSILAGPDDRDFRSEFRAQYDEKRAEQAPSFKPQPTVGPQAPFEGTSTHQQDYQPWKAQPRQPYGNRDFVFTGPEDRDFKTEHRGNFEPKVVHPCEAIPLQVSHKNRPGHIYHVRDGTGHWNRTRTPVPTNTQTVRGTRVRPQSAAPRVESQRRQEQAW